MDVASNVATAWGNFSAKIVHFLPNLLAAIFIFFVGWFLAKLVRALITRVLGAVRFDTLTERAGINSILTKGNIYKKPSEVLAILAYWFLLLIVIVASFDALGLPVIYELLNKILLYIPNVIAAIVVLIFGTVLANFLGSFLKTFSSGLGDETATLLSRIGKYAVIILAITMALQQLNIATPVVTAAFSILFGALCLALALAFGLGGTDAAASYLQKFRGAKSK